LFWGAAEVPCDLRCRNCVVETRHIPEYVLKGLWKIAFHPEVIKHEEVIYRTAIFIGTAILR
jgi:hypothetical protein